MTQELYFLKPGYLYVTLEPTRISTVLGSCVSVIFYDTRLRYGGMNHYVLPRNPHKGPGSTKFGEDAVPELYAQFHRFGSAAANIVARIAGGAYMDESPNSKEIAQENVLVAKRMLAAYGIPIISANTGGTKGRQVNFMSGTNEIEVLTVGQEGASRGENQSPGR